jgi:hypothetical protein
MSDYGYRALIIVDATVQEAANEFWKKNIDPEGGEFTFTVPLSLTGMEPATNYVCETSLTKEQLEQVSAFVDANPFDVIMDVASNSSGDEREVTDRFDAVDGVAIRDPSFTRIKSETGLRSIVSDDETEATRL